MIIIEYINCEKVKVLFTEYNWVSDYVQMGEIRKGTAKCPYEKRLYKIGYLGEGKYKTTENNKATKYYIAWHNMIQRCYDPKYHDSRPYYKDCEVCTEWHNFQNFAEWYENNYYEVEGERMHLDKDILFKGNKVYSPQNCVFVPQIINSLFTKNNKNRGELPIGVNKLKNGKYRSRCNILDGNKNKLVTIGTYDTIIQAFTSYKYFKEKYIKEVANKYKDVIPEKLYKAMYNYEVEIGD